MTTPTAGPARRRARRVLMIAPTSFFGDYGCHVRILEEARVLQRLGQQVTIATYRNGRDPDGLDLRRTWPIPWRTGYEVGSSRHKIAFDALLGGTVLRAALATRPDVIHGHLHEGALLGAVVARLFRRPLVFDYQGSLSAEMVDHGFLNPAGRFHAPLRRLERWIDHAPDAIVTSSRRAVPQLVEDFGVPRARVHALPDCVDAERFRPDLLPEARRRVARRALGIPEGRTVVAYLGLLARHQGTNLLLHVAKRVREQRPDLHFLIMGYPGTDYYAARAKELGVADGVTFTGRVPYELAPERLALGDLAVAPKISVTEGSGKLLNYMAAALPTVTFDLPVNREFLGAEGVYARPGDPDDFADRVLELAADPARAGEIGRRLRAKAIADFDWTRAGEMLIGLYDRVAAGRGRRAAEGGGRPAEARRTREERGS